MNLYQTLKSRLEVVVLKAAMKEEERTKTKTMNVGENCDRGERSV
jgi:hypothetical protein